MIAIIPARGGSKGLPGKNIKLLAGKPLIAHTIEAAKNAKNVSRVIISTDSPEIAEIAVQYGAECPFLRPEYLATDTSLAIDTYLYTIKELEKIDKESVEDVVILLPTAPIRKTDDIDNAIMLFREKDADSVISYCQEFHPIWWHKYVNGDGKLINIFDNNLKNRQEENVTYFPNGSIYIFKKSILENHTYYTEKSYAYIMDRESSVDIDTIEDFDYAEFLIKKINK